MPKKIKHFIVISKWKSFTVLAISFGLQFFLFLRVYAAETATIGGAVGAGTGWLTNAVASLVLQPAAWVILALSWFIGQLSTMFTYILFVVVRYNNFINEEVVVKGWVIVRDICNMGFVLIMLIIAFTTILRIDGYEWKKLLKKVILMAILINFSRTIVGLIIDVSQIVMMTFVSPLLGANNSVWGHGALINAMQLGNTLSLSSMYGVVSANFTTGVTPITVFGSLLVAFIALTIAFGVILSYTAVLFVRIISLWMLIITSPLAFLAASFPGGQKYSSMWWGQFLKNVLVGPFMAFYLWLALMASNIQSNGQGLTKGFDFNESSLINSSTANFTSGFLNGLFSPNGTGVGNFSSMLQYIMVIGFLIIGMQQAQEAGGAIAKAASATNNWSKRVGNFGRRVLQDAAIGQVNRPGVRNMLANIGGRTGMPVVGTLGVNRLATRAYTGLGARQRSVDQQAQAYVGSINDIRILRRLANQNAVTPMARAVRNAARHKAPSTIDIRTNPNAIRDHVNDEMSNQQRGALSRNEMYRLGQNATFNPGESFHDYLQTPGNADARGAYNAAAGAAINGINPQTGAILAVNPTGTNYTPPVAPNLNAYKKAKKKQIQSSEGAVSVNRFSRGQDNTIGADFRNLPPGVFDDAGVNPKDLDGVNIVDQNKIAIVSAAMSKMLGEKISNGDLGANQLELMKNAKLKFDSISSGQTKIDNLSMVNSGAESYRKLSNVKETKLHEEVHGAGARNSVNPQHAEDYIDRNVENMMQNKLYSQRDKIGQAYNQNNGVSAHNPSLSHEYGEPGGADTNNAVDNNKLINALENLTKKVGDNTMGVGKLATDFSKNAQNLNVSVKKNAEQTYLRNRRAKEENKIQKKSIEDLKKSIDDKIV